MSSFIPALRTRFQPRFLVLLLVAFAVAVALVWKSGPLDRAAHASATAAFTPGNLVVYRVGSGTGSLLGTGNPVFLDEFTPAGALVQSIALPTTDSLPNQSLVANGTSTSEGLLTRSADGQYLILTGYDVTPPHSGTVSASTSALVNRVIGRVDGAGTINTTTALSDGFSGGNIRSAVSTDGNTFWASGSVDGVRTTTLGSTTSTVVSTTGTNLRQLNIFNGQLYVSSGAGALRVATVGSGTPTTPGQTITNINGIPTTGSPYNFFFADLDAGVAGVDTLYVADDAAQALRKYSLVGGSWSTLNGTIGVDTDDYRGLTAIVSGTTVTLYVTRLGSSDADGGGELVSLVDASGYNGAFSGTPTLLATAATNTAFRGVALVPGAPAESAPSVLNTTPANGTNNIPLASNIAINFSEPVNVSGSSFTISCATSGTHTFVLGGSGASYTLNPDSDFTGNELCTVTVVANQVTDVDASDPPDNMAADYVFSFTTVSSTPALSINDVSQAETNAGTTTFTFTVSLSAPAQAGGVSFTVNTADGTTNPANAGSDYVAIVGGSGSISIGNSSTTVLVTVNGDGTTEPNETFFVNLSAVVGATVSDAQGLGTIQNDDVNAIPIHDIQGSGFTSPFNTQSVTTTGIVTGRKTNGFFIQDPAPDANVNTSEAIFVFTSSAPSATINVGDSVQVTGTVAEFIPAGSEEPVTPTDPRTATELTSPVTVILSSGSPPPPAIDAVTANIFDPTAVSRGAQLEKYEYMRVSVGSITVSEPTNGFAEFYGVVTGVPRPFREPGIERGDAIQPADEGPFAGSVPPNLPIFDGNFERIQVDSDDATSTANVRRLPVNVTTGTVVTGIVGPLDYAFDSYRIVLDFSSVPGITPGITAAIPAPTPTAQEFTIGHANLENFTSNAGRLNKASLAIRNVMRNPDILGIIEVDTAATATALANKVNSDAASPATVNYVAYFSETGATQDIGYLVNTARVTVVGSPAAHNSAGTFTYCGVSNVLHDRPSFVLTATLPEAGGGIIPVTVILNHTKSLIAVDSPAPYGICGTGTEGARNREKRRKQAEDIANLIQTHIAENLVVLGDLNAFDFNDGLGDVVGTFRGTPAPANQVVEPSTDNWTYQLTNLVYKLPADQRYSLLFEGNAQALDHVLVNDPMYIRNNRFAYGRYNSDFSVDYAADTNRPEGLSDHDASIAYFAAVPTAANGIVSGRIADPNGVPVAGAVVNMSGTQNRKGITDANGNYRFENVETNGFYSVRPAMVNYHFSPEVRSFSQLGNNTDATFTATRDSMGGANPIDTPEYFVRQHYLDFLGREPDESGFNFWSDQMLECGSDAACLERRTINVSAAYFISIEFGETGGLVDRLYRASYGRRPLYSEFMPDTRTVAANVVVGSGPWAETLRANKEAFLNAWVERAAFRAAYDGLSNASYVDTLISHTGVSFPGAEREALVSSLNNQSATRAEALRQIAENSGFVSAKRNEAFVMMQYFGYLHRDPDASGYQFWLNKLNQFDGNFEQAEMVKAFIVSGEYRDRFRL